VAPNDKARTVLLLDRSLDVSGGHLQRNWAPAKQVALEAVEELQPVALVVYCDTAAVVGAEDLQEMTWAFVYGANLAAGLDLACDQLGGTHGHILVISYSDPSSHNEPGGAEVFFSIPTADETEVATLAAAQRCADGGVTIDVRLLGEPDGVIHHAIAEMTGGRVIRAHGE
jgi:uncharacterized protein with von Willebrand factor type A (vWA) domain